MVCSSLCSILFVDFFCPHTSLLLASLLLFLCLIWCFQHLVSSKNWFSMQCIPWSRSLIKMLNKTVTNANPSGTQLDTSLQLSTLPLILTLCLWSCQPVFSPWVYHISALWSLSTEQDFLEKLHQTLSPVALFHQWLSPFLKIINLSDVLFISHIFFWLPFCLSFFLKLVLLPYCLCFVSTVYIVCQHPANICQDSFPYLKIRKEVYVYMFFKSNTIL